MGFPVTQQIKSYFGLDGLPLNQGFVYFGSPGLNPETNAIQMFWDAALTVVAPQPFRTVGGYISRNGTPANVFASGDFSSTLRDSKGQLVYTVANSVDFIAAGTVAATAVSIANAGGFYTGTQVEAALAEIAASLASLATGNMPTGASIDFCGTVAPAGFVISGGGTIGNVASNATQRNNADTSALYTLIYNSSTNAEIVIQDSAGTPTTRGASAAADFAANKRLPLPDRRGRVSAGKDDMGILGISSPARITAGGAGIVGTTQFATGGTQTHTLVSPGEIPAHTHTQNAHTHTQDAHGHTQVAHTHTITDPTHVHNSTVQNVATENIQNASDTSRNYALGTTTTAGTSSAATGITAANANTATNQTTIATNQNATAVNQNTGSGGAHQNTQPTIMFTVIIKL